MTPNCRTDSTGSSTNFRHNGTRGRLVVFALACLCGAGGGGVALATTRTVCSSGCNFTSIQAAINASSNGDVVEVWDGTYNEHDLDFGGKAITVKSKDGADNCIVDVQGNGRGFHFHNSETSSSVLDGFTIRNGDKTGGNAQGGGIRCNGPSPLIKNCIIEDCTAYFGGGIALVNDSAAEIRDCMIQNCDAVTRGGGVYIEGSSPTLLRVALSFNDASSAQGGGMATEGNCSLTVDSCLFEGNAAYTGGGAYFGWQATSGSPVIRDCAFLDGNSAVDYGGGLAFGGSISVTVLRCVIDGNIAALGGGGFNGDSGCTLSLTNCQITNNTCSDGQGNGLGGAAELYADTATFTNCTIADNVSDDGGGGIQAFSATVTIYNCILWGNASGGPYDQYDGSTPTVRYTDIGQTGFSGNGNKNTDPLFADPGSGDYRLSRGSPCIDAAKNSYCGSACDSGGDLLGATRKSDHLCTTDGGDGTAPIIDMGCFEAGTGIIFVDKDATGGNDGLAWSSAYTDLQNGFSKAGDTSFADYDPAACELWVAEGSYKTSQCSSCSDADKQKSFALVDDIGVYGRFTGNEATRAARGLAAQNETILTGQIGLTSLTNAYHVVTGTSGLTATAVLDGFTIKKGKANGSSGSDLDKGGGVYLNAASPTLEGLKITANQADYGGGMYLKGGAEPALTSITFDDNDADFGAGMYSTGSSWEGPATDCVFSLNVADNGSNTGKGGAVYIADDSLGGGHTQDFLRCTFKYNQAVGGGGGGLYVTSSGRNPVLKNCVFYGNQATYDGETPGGGIYTNRKVTLTNVTLANNTCTLDNGGAGMYNAAGDSVLTNCILYYNAADGEEQDERDHISGDLDDVSVTYSCIDNLDLFGDPDFFNTGTEPLFVNEMTDDYCINNTGCNTTCQSLSIDGGLDNAIGETLDLKKHTRKIDLKPGDEKVDMGPIETQNATGSPCG